MTITRIKGKNLSGSYVVSVFVANGRLDKCEITGKPHASIVELCRQLSISHTRLVEDALRAIKFTMAKRLEYEGEA